MTLRELAQVYVDLVNLDNQTLDSEQHAKEEIGLLRSKYHQLFMDKLQEEGIEFVDRFDAMNKAFDLAEKEAPASRLGNLTIG